MAKVDDHWVETALISLTKSGGSAIEFAALTDEMSFGGGERDIAVRTLLNGGNLRRFTPMTITEVNFKMYPDQVNDAMQFFGGTANTKSSGVITTTNILTRFDIRVIVLWTTQAATAAGEQITTADDALRMIAINGNITKCTPFWDDGEQGFDVTVKIPAYNRTATGNITWASTDGAGNLAAAGTYP